MGFIIKNITNFLSKTNRYYNKEITIFDSKKNIVLQPKEEYYIKGDILDNNIKRLSALKYVQYTYISDNDQFISVLNNDNIIIDKKNQNFKKNFIKKEVKNIIKTKKTVNKNNLVSVIIVNYNCGNYIERAIESVLNQTYKNIELIIVDDNSNDNSIDVIKKYLKDDRISLYKSNTNMGPYWAKNTAIQKCNGDFITMLDADDYDVETKIEEQVNAMAKNINLVTCLNKRHNEEPCFGYPSMMWRKNVFEKIGYYDYIRFGADSEFFDRYLKVFGKKTTKHIKKVLQIGTRRENSLTSIVPEKSNIRKEYVKQYTNWHNSSQTNDLYIDFPLKNRKFTIPSQMEINKIISFHNISKINPEKGVLPVIMCVWKRVEGFEKIIDQLNNQNYKNFKLFVWNNNTAFKNEFENILKKSNFEYEIIHSEENIGGFGRFYYAKKIRRKPGLMDYCVFIDDDQTFGSDLLSTFVNEMEPKTIKAQWGWRFDGLDYYRNRVNVQPGEVINYGGTGGMVADMSVFEDENLYSCKKEYWFVEDLWLSYFANSIHKYKLIKSSAKVKNGDDEHSLYKRVLDVKTPMLNYLVNDLEWEIFKKKSVTLIIPTFNNTEYIDECILSIINNKSNNINIEILIGIDNCEKTKKHVLNNELYKNVNIYYFNVNVGPYIVKNTLIRNAKNENIIFFDSDDYFLKDTIKDIIDLFDTNDYILFKYNDVRNGNIKTTKAEYGEGVFGIKKTLFINNNGFYPWRCAADSEFKQRILSSGVQPYKHDEIVFNRRVHNNSLTKSKETGYNSDIRQSYVKKINENKKNNYPNPYILFTESDYHIIN